MGGTSVGETVGPDVGVGVGVGLISHEDKTITAIKQRLKSVGKRCIFIEVL